MKEFGRKALLYVGVGSAWVLGPVDAAIIDASNGNGGFVSETSSFNGSLEGWTAERGVWVDSGNSGLSTDPFGADNTSNSRFVQIHNNSGETLTSSRTFTVAQSDTIELSFDYKTGGSGDDTTLTVSLWDTQANTTYATLGSISTSSSQASFIQVNYSLSAPSANTNLQLRFSLSAGGKDVHIDRVHLVGGEITPPPPPAVIDYDTVQYLDPSDSEAVRIEKAAKLLPSPRQVDWQRLETTYFIHFGPNTFNEVEWGDGRESVDDFNPTAYDASQWVNVIKNAGGTMLMLVVKHHEGFCLFPSRYTDHDLESSAWQSGTGNVVRDVADACAAAGIKFGVYLSPADLYQIESATNYTTGSGYYGHGSATRLSTIPTNPATFGSDPTQGRTPPAGFESYEYQADDYNRYFLNQLYELLTEYGDIAEVWFDGATPKNGPQPQAYNRHDWYDLIRKLQPGANIAVKGPDVRWVGNEHGHSRETEWSPIPIPQHPDVYTWGDATATDLGSRARLTGGNYLTWWPAEADVPILSGWFHTPSRGVKSANTLIDIYYKSVGRNSNLLLNLSPDKRGLIPENQITPLMEAMTIVQQTFSNNLALDGTVTADSELAESPASRMIDGDLDSYWESEAGNSTPTVTLTMPEVRTFDRVVLQEAIAQRGMRVETFAIDAWINGAWVQQATSTCVGHKRILQIPEVTTDRVRIRITQSRTEPTLANVGLYQSAELLDSPQIAERDAAGRVVITAAAGDTIHYTIDGTTPTMASPTYSGAVDLPLGGTVRAIAVNGNSVSFETIKTFSGYSPTGWTVISVSSEEGAEPGSYAIDDDPSTNWHTDYAAAAAHPHHLTVDMGSVRWIGGFSYLPRGTGANGIAKNYVFEVSTDNSEWTTVATGEFLNIKNNPVLQQVPFDAIEARYFRFTASDEVNNANWTSAAEINVLPGGFDGFRQQHGLQTSAPTSDSDNDGQDLLAEYYFGNSPVTKEQMPVPIVAAPVAGGVALEVVRDSSAVGVTPRFEMTETLDGWEPVTPSSVSSTELGGGKTRDVYSFPVSGLRRFFRVLVQP
ncbi:discoidin domain-containing protein [Sulfuriroseicoccus oceanibius]|uniref:alpha-L-fucosidase n=1 Tax=Sulfuriroseicoccus oceanibius TaxID=2707525 RepID=A0A6B3L232_9BACT|nr:discoidin domain-containing protein [Sulfuriroseicoccus oceanibius]QQL45588.1 alpha-L-fucosidase [Sulfuriroseicoccus oceanibius]